MAYGAEVATHLYGAHFPGHTSFTYTERAMQFVGKDNQLSLIRLEDGEYFTIRLHDQITPGGFPLTAGFSFEADLVPWVAASVSVLPTEFSLGASQVAIDLDLSGGGLDLTTWALADRQENVVVRVRKIDSTANRLTWTDHLGITYRFVDRQGEFITLLWSKQHQRFFIW